MFVIFALMLVSSTSFARSKLCISESITKECKKGDVILLVSDFIGDYCDFSKEIVLKYTDRSRVSSYWCVYVGYKRSDRNKWR